MRSPVLREATSRFAQLQKLYNVHLREWYWQRNMGTKYQTWLPPGVLFCAMKKDHYDIGFNSTPTWENWWFHDIEKPLIVCVGSGLWCLDLANTDSRYNVLYIDNDDKNIFNTLLRAIERYQINVDDMEPFINFRIMFGNYRLLPQILPGEDFFKPVRLHLHYPQPQKTIAPPIRGMTVKAPTFEPQGMPISLQRKLIDMLAEHGSLHVASNNLDQAHIIAAQMLELKHVFDPTILFPFFQEGLPPNYGSIGAVDKDKPIFYQEWHKSDRKLPNSLFRGKRLTE